MSGHNTIDALRTDGATLLDEGEFELDRDRARQKMQKFQLADPQHYVLELVQAAHLLGATWIEFTIDADEMEMRFDGESLNAGELDEMYNAVFSKRVDDRGRALRHLAIGLTAARALEPSVLRVESVQEEETVVLEASGDIEELTARAEAPERGNTRIYLREKFRLSHLKEFFRNRRGDLAEKTALRERCTFARAKIYLDGEGISYGFHLPSWAAPAHQFEVTVPLERGLIAMTPDAPNAKATILQNGVTVAEHQLRDPLVRVRAVIDSKRLNKNLSQSAFVEDDAWETFRDQFLPAATYALIYDYVSQRDTAELLRGREWLRRLWLKLAVEAARLDPSKIAVRQRQYQLSGLLESLPALVQFLEELPLFDAFTAADQSVDDGIAHVSINELLGDDAPYLFYTSESTIGELPEGAAAVLYFPDGPPFAFMMLYAKKLVDAGVRQRNQAAWRARPWTEFPTRESAAGARELRTENMSATFAPAKHPEASSRVVLIEDGHILQKKPFGIGALGPLRGFDLHIYGGLPVNITFDDVQPNDEFLELAALTLEALPDFIASHAEQMPALVVQKYLDALLRGLAAEHLLTCLAIPPSLESVAIQERLASLDRSPWSLPERIESDTHRKGPDRIEVRMRLNRLGDLTRAAIFRDASGRSICLEDIYECFVEHRKLWVLWRDDQEHLADAPLVITSNMYVARILQRLFGRQAVQAQADRDDSKRVDARAERFEPDEPMQAELRQAELRHAPDEPAYEPEPADDPEPADESIEPIEHVAELLDDHVLAALEPTEEGRLTVRCVGGETLELQVPVSTARYVRARPEDPVARAFLASALYTALARDTDEITEADETMLSEQLIDDMLDTTARSITRFER